jgi:hypothetical protein
MKFSLIKGLIAYTPALRHHLERTESFQMRTPPNFRATFGTNVCRQQSGFAQNKVLAIMEHRIFQKQGYLDTGNQKITEQTLPPLRNKAHFAEIPRKYASIAAPKASPHT